MLFRVPRSVDVSNWSSNAVVTNRSTHNDFDWSETMPKLFRALASLKNKFPWKLVLKCLIYSFTLSEWKEWESRKTVAATAICDTSTEDFATLYS